MKVFVVVKNNGSEGYDKPYGVFSSPRDVDTFLAGAKAAYGSGFEILAFDVDTNQDIIDRCKMVLGEDDDPPPNWGGAGAVKSNNGE